MEWIYILSIFIVYSTFEYSGEKLLSQYNKKFSDLNEEIILADLIKNFPEINKFYVDIGAADGVWSNTARLALNGWGGLGLECDPKQVRKFNKTYRKITKVRAYVAKVTPLNVGKILEIHNVPEDFGVLSLDIDSYDYFVLESLLDKFRPTIIIAEINEKFPPPLEFTVLFNDDHVWDYSHFFGQSISQIEKLCVIQNYAIVQLEYNNVFLIDKNKYSGESLTAKEAYESGYQFKADRKQKFFWNHDMEILLTSNPEENVRFLDEYFARYKGKYSLTISRS